MEIFVSRLSAQIFFTTNIHIACWYCMSIYESDSVSTDIHYQRTRIQIRATKTLSEYFLALSVVTVNNYCFTEYTVSVDEAERVLLGIKSGKFCLIITLCSLWCPKPVFFWLNWVHLPPVMVLESVLPQSLLSHHLISFKVLHPPTVCFFLLGYWYSFIFPSFHSWLKVQFSFKLVLQS